MAGQVVCGMHRLTSENYRELAAMARSQTSAGRFTEPPRDTAEFLARRAVCPVDLSTTALAIVVDPTEPRRRRHHLTLKLVDHLWTDYDDPVPEAERQLSTIEGHLEHLLWQFSSDRGCAVVLLFPDQDQDREKLIDETVRAILESLRKTDPSS